MIAIVNYNAGNIKSIQNMLRRLGIDAEITNDPEVIKKSEKLILPGVGHFDYGMNNLKETGLIESLNQKVLTENTPILGICLGAQMLGNKSEEGDEPGLGWIDMDIVKFDTTRLDEGLKIPHMGWREVVQKKDSLLFEAMYADPRFYFVHSYHMQTKNENDILTTSSYGYHFTSSVQHKNIIGVQFHPEKSHKFGMKLLENFSKI